MAQSAHIRPSRSGSVSVHLSGELDLVSAPAITEQLAAAMTLSPDLVVDLDDVTFLDVVVINALVLAQQQALLHDGSLVVVGATPWVEKVLHASGATEAIPLLPHPRAVHTSERGSSSLVSALRNRRTVC